MKNARSIKTPARKNSEKLFLEKTKKQKEVLLETPIKEEVFKIKKSYKLNFKLFGIVFCGMILVVSIFFAWYFYNKFKILSEEVEAVKMPINEKNVLIQEIEKFMDLPDEDPILATVSDVEKTKNQAFFAKALNGDKVLIYTNAKKAILYRPVEKKVIEIANVSDDVNDKKNNLENFQITDESNQAKEE